MSGPQLAVEVVEVLDCGDLFFGGDGRVCGGLSCHSTRHRGT